MDFIRVGNTLLLHHCEQEREDSIKCAYSIYRGSLCDYPISDKEWSETYFKVPCPMFKSKEEFRIENKGW